MNFLVSRRWVLFAFTVVVLAYVAYVLGQWQFHRLQDREAFNAQTRQNLRAAPAPVGDLLSAGRPSRMRDEWRRVRATGTYQPARSVLIRYQTRDGVAGVDVVTPLRTGAGPSLLVDRGWLRAGDVAAGRVDAPAPPAGRVTVVGYVRADATGDATAVTDGSARAISSVAIAKATGLRVYRGFVDAVSENPASTKPLVSAPLPDLGNGPHFFYGLQWWFFGLLALFGFGYLAYDERRRLRAARLQAGDGTRPAAGRHPPGLRAPGASHRPPGPSRR